MFIFITGIDDCAGVDCSQRGICVDGVKSKSCECFDRYDGSDCRMGMLLEIIVFRGIYFICKNYIQKNNFNTI